MRNVGIKIPSYCYILLVSSLLVLWSSCRKDFDFEPASGNLAFSKDTVFLDTIFSNIGSSTYALKVYNTTSTDIAIPSIRLREGTASGYRLNVDGDAGKEFSNVELLAKDSLFIFVETTLNISDTGDASFLYTDAIQFNSGDNLQEVQLVTLVQDAVFIFPPTNASGEKETLLLGLDADGAEIRVEGITLKNDQLNFTNEKPYVIYGYAAVPENATLTMAPGTRVYFHENSGIWVQEGASLSVNGALSEDPLALENEIIFEGDRLEPEFDDIPGQWGTIWLSEGSTNNQVNHLTIKNAAIGILVEGISDPASPTLTISNSQIYNSASVNLWARTAAVEGSNLVLGNAGAISLYCNLGGNYTFTHATIANYWSKSFRGGEALRIDNVVDFQNGQILTGNLTKADFTNSIIDGNSFIELALISNNSNDFSFSFTNCLIQFNDAAGTLDDDPLYDFENSTFYNNIFINENTDFIDTSENVFQIGESSAARSNAQQAAAELVPTDILGIDRTTDPAVGAYQYAPDN